MHYGVVHEQVRGVQLARFARDEGGTGGTGQKLREELNVLDPRYFEEKND
jgi:hypothetical protein